MRDKTTKIIQKNSKIALVGPLWPYRGGIAQFNTQLSKALGRRNDQITISFKRQYPKWLYPGESDIESEDAEYISDVDYIIDAYSPLSLRRAADKIIKSGCDTAILNWWTFFWQPGFAYIARRLRKKGIKTILFCHNVVEHDGKGIRKTVSKFFIKQADAYVVLATEEAKNLREIKPSAEILNIRALPIFSHYPAPAKKFKKRGHLELLFFGFIRPYKGLDVLIDALSLLKDDRIYLTVVGEYWGDRKDLEAHVKKSGANNIEMHLEYVDDKQAAEYFYRSDVVVLPYKTATSSAVATLAYNYDKPILGTKTGGLIDLIEDSKTGWLVEPSSADALAKKISSLNRKQVARAKPFIREFCKQHSWDNLATQILELSKKVDKL